MLNQKSVANFIKPKNLFSYLMFWKIFIWCNIFLVNFAQATELLQHKSINGYSHGISLFGDLKYPQNFQALDYVNQNASKGGEIRYGVEGGFNSLNNFILKGIPAQGLSLIYDNLAESVDDEMGSRYGVVANGIKISNDRLKMDFILRRNVYFHDGVNATADDVIFTFNKLISDGHPSYKMSLRDVKNVEKINKYS
ncbi:MAG: hypothetical protein FJX30_00785, partial [Alphaproteobacteria bacterium]|nr:hypothetical protein [Alphaproteobacteria bacterium]